MRAPKVTMAWAIWLDWEKLNPRMGSRGHWFPGGERMVRLYPTRREAASHRHFDFERVVRVKIVRAR
jgi:hypothetical protein